MVSEGSYTVGGPGSGADYSSINDAIANTTNLTGDITFTLIADTVENNGGPWTSKYLNGHTFKITSNARHNGQVGAGHVSLCNTQGINIATFDGGTFIVEYLQLVPLAGAYNILILRQATGTGFNLSMHDILVDCRGMQSGVTFPMVSFYSGSNSSQAGTFSAYNVAILDYWAASAGNAALYTDLYGDLKYMYLENCFVSAHPSASTGYGIRTRDTFSLSSVFLKNCVSIGPAAQNYLFGGTTEQVDNCMSEDGSVSGAPAGSGNIPNITPANEFQSLTATDTNFLWPTSSGQADNGGTAVVIGDNDHSMLTTIARPHGASYSIGPFEFPPTPAITVQPTDQSVTEGNNATFSVTATGAQTYQWYVNSAPISGATDSSYTKYDVGGGEHLDEYKVDVISDAGTVTSDTVKMLVNGWPAGTGAAAPNPPTVSSPALVGQELTITVAGTADTFIANLLDEDSNIVTSDQRDGTGDLTVTIPDMNEIYVLSVQAGNYGSPASWSLPGVVATIYLRETVTGTTITGSTFDTKISAEALEAGPLGVGLSFPFRVVGETGKLAVSYGIDHVKEGMRQVIGTPLRERFMRREFGSNVRRSLMETIPTAEASIGQELVSALAKWERRIRIERLKLTKDRNNGEVSAEIDFTAKKTYQEGNLVYPFTSEPDGGE